MDLQVQDAIYDINNIIDDATVNSMYEERGHNFEAEYYDHLVFSITNYRKDSSSVFKSIVDDVVQDIERLGYVVFDVIYDRAYATIEVSKSY